jgi:hypothetical protein
LADVARATELHTLRLLRGKRRAGPGRLKWTLDSGPLVKV